MHQLVNKYNFDLFYVTYNTKFPLGGPVSRVIRTNLATKAYRPDDRCATLIKDKFNFGCLIDKSFTEFK